MTVPRQVVPGATYLVTRRCSQRQYLLRPSELTNDVFLYLLAVAASRFEIVVHAYCVLSNHFHLVVTDPNARLPAFHQFLDALVARALNAALGRCESFWAPNSYSAVALASPADVLDKSAYVLANPVAAGLVRSARLWPGLWSAPEQIGGAALQIHRPKHFFDPKGGLPEVVSLQLTVPAGFESVDPFRDQLCAAVADRESRAARDRGDFVGVEEVLRRESTSRPSSVEPRRKLRPRVAARDPWKRIEALRRVVEFVRAYREAWARRREGDTDVVFPFGTYLLRVVHGVPCASFG
jgi:REP-associated tyrosine transposase